MFLQARTALPCLSCQLSTANIVSANHELRKLQGLKVKTVGNWANLNLGIFCLTDLTQTDLAYWHPGPQEIKQRDKSEEDCGTPGEDRWNSQGRGRWSPPQLPRAGSPLLPSGMRTPTMSEQQSRRPCCSTVTSCNIAGFTSSRTCCSNTFCKACN